MKTKKIEKNIEVNKYKKEIKDLKYMIDVTVKFIDNEGLIKDYYEYIKELQCQFP